MDACLCGVDDFIQSTFLVNEDDTHSVRLDWLVELCKKMKVEYRSTKFK